MQQAQEAPVFIVPPSPSLSPEVERYLQHLRVHRRLAERTLVLYTHDLQRLQASAHALGLELLQLQAAHMRRLVAQMHSGGRSPRGIALILSGWRGFYTWAVREGLLERHPLLDVRAPRAPKPLPKALPVDEAVRLADFHAEAVDPWQQARDGAMIELLYGSGLRVGELVGLNMVASSQALQQGRGWIDLQAAEVQVQGKGSRRRSVPMGPPALAALRAWLALRAQPFAGKSARLDGQALFVGRRGARLSIQSAWAIVRDRGQEAGMTRHIHPHMLRHSCASHVLQSSGDLRGVQELLGHASITSTQAYTRLDFQHLARVYDQAHPRARKGDADG